MEHDYKRVWAFLGASLRLKEIDAEAAKIYAAFPQLKQRSVARSEAMRRAWAKRRAAKPRPDA